MDDPQFPILFGEWLKSRRKALDLTQEELAQRTGCSVFALRKIETGERRPSKQLAGLLASALDIPDIHRSVFIRVARGELNLERLCLPASDLIPSPPFRLPVIHHLPLPPTPLLGRDSELAAMARIFNDPQCSLLTLTGVGGIGKTRLAIEFASRWRDRFPAGVHYIPLASISSAELIVHAVAEALELSFSGPTDPKAQLFNYFTHEMKQSALLVMDNFEHLLAQSSSAVDLVAEILQGFPSIKILCTSRERLNLRGEWIYELHGLPIPPPGYACLLEDYKAADLFIQCARRMDAEFKPTEADRPALIRICQVLEGIPLAIELAAAWVTILSCRDIAREIEASIDFLTTSMRDIPERHRSLRATFDHSWRLLSAAERDSLSRLSVFRGGFDRTAAEQIAGASLPLLSSLVSKSLVRRTQDGRYDLHEVIRQYALDCLNEDPSRCFETRDSHCHYYLHLSTEYEQKLKSASQQAAVHDMAIEFDNMRAAWDWGIRREKYDLLGRTVRSFGWYFEVSGLIYDGIDHMEQLVQSLTAVPRSSQMEQALGASLVQQGLLYFRSGQFARALERYQNAIPILRAVNARPLLADALIFNGTLLHLTGDLIEARELIQEGWEIAQEVNDPWFCAYGIYNLGHIDSQMGEYQKGYEQMQAGLSLWRELGDPHSISLGLNFLVETQIKLGRFEKAVASMQESLALCKQTKNRWGIGTAYRYLGLAALASGRYFDAISDLKKSLEVFGEYFTGWDIARSLTYLGAAEILADELQEAEKTYQEALHLSLEIQSTPLVLDAILGLARLRLVHGEVEKAFELAQYVSNQAASTLEARENARQMILQIEKQFGNRRVQTWRDSAMDQSLEAVLERCL